MGGGSVTAVFAVPIVCPKLARLPAHRRPMRVRRQPCRLAALCSYFDGKPSYSRLTGCWDDLFEYYNWSNVVCVPRAHPLYAVMERGSLRYQMFEATYYQQAGTGAQAQLQ